MEFGMPIHKREEYFNGLRLKSDQQKNQRIEFMGETMYLPVWKIPISLPKYRLENGRTISLQREWLAKNPDKPEDYFRNDPESNEVQKVQHILLRTLMNETSLYTFFSQPYNKQKQCLTLDYHGFVVNGNRRLCTWRELFYKDSHKYSHYEYIDVIVLPKSDEKAIDQLEAELQITEPEKAEYQWHTLANKYYELIQKDNFSPKSLASIYHIKESEIKFLIDKRQYAIDYMISRGIKENWSAVTQKEYAFEQLVKCRKKLNDPAEISFFENAAYAIIDNPPIGRVYEAIPDLLKYKDKVKEKLSMLLPPTNDDEDTLETDEEENGDQGLIYNPDNDVSALDLAHEIDKPINREAVSEIIKDVIETERIFKSYKDTVQSVMKNIQMGNQAIQNALACTKQKEASKDGILEVIDNIEDCIRKIKEWLMK